MANNNKTQGFTLIEIAMVMVIFASLLSGFGYGLVAYQKQQRYKVTKFRMDAIQKALDEFLELNGRLPCVGRLDRRPGQAQFGFEVDSDPGPLLSCNGPIAGSWTRYDPDVGVLAGTLGGAGSGWWVRYGPIPVRTLNLPDSYILDGWGSRFRYYVTIRQASDLLSNAGVTYTDGAGAINIVDTNGNDVIDQSNPKFSTCGGACRNFADYALVSHGPDRKGGATLYEGRPGAAFEAIPCGAVSIQTPNCMHPKPNPNIIVSNVISSNDSNRDYDDLVVYRAGSDLNETLPSGAVIGYDQYFNESGGVGTRAFTVAGDPGITPASVSTTVFTCPVGWQPFVPAQGRFIMGATSAGAPFSRTRRHSTLTVSSSPRNYRNLGKSSETPNATLSVWPLVEVRRTIPPYVTTFFCEKQ